MDIQIWCPSTSSVGGGLRKGAMASASTSVWEKVASLALILVPNNSVPPHVSLAPFKLLPQCWSSEGVSLSKSMCGPFKNCLRLQNPSISLSHNPWCFLQPKVMGSSLHGTGTLGLGGLVWGWDPSIFEGHLCSQAIPPDFYVSHMGVWPVCLASLSLLPVSMWPLLYIHSCKTS